MSRTLLLRVGDVLITHQSNTIGGSALAEEPIVAVERIPGRVRTVSICVPGVNTFVADGAWPHNTIAPSILTTMSGSSSSGTKGSGSSFGGGGQTAV